MENTLKNLGRTICYLLMLVGFLSIILFIMGYRPLPMTDVSPAWEAIGSLAEWVAGLAIPIAIFVIDKRMKKRDEETQRRLLKELEEFKNKYEEKIIVLDRKITEKGELIADGVALIEF